MKENILDLNTFSRDSTFYGEINLLLTVKSFDLQAIRKRYIASRANKSGKAGSVERREPTEGGIVSLKLENGTIKDDSILCKVFEPRGIDLNQNNFAFAAENRIYIVSEKGESTDFTNPWFSYIHTVQFHPGNLNQILVSSSGYDLIQEYDYTSNELLFEWFAWENGFDKGFDPELQKEIVLTRNRSFAEQLAQNNTPYYLVENPEEDYLPTAKRAAFINSVTYHPDIPDRLLATFFHEGKVIQINKSDNSIKSLIQGLKNPHGGHVYGKNVLATSTASGEIVIANEIQQSRISFKNLPGKPSELENLEWIQNTLSVDNHLVAIDSNRSSFTIINLKERLYDQIPYNNNWAIQDLVLGILSDKQRDVVSFIK